MNRNTSFLMCLKNKFVFAFVCDASFELVEYWPTKDDRDLKSVGNFHHRNLQKVRGYKAPPKTATKMNTPRLATSILLRTSRTSIPRSTRQFRHYSPLPIRASPKISTPPLARFYSQQPSIPSKIYTFSDVTSPASTLPHPFHINTQHRLNPSPKIPPPTEF